jgi:hypothetical protein
MDCVVLLVLLHQCEIEPKTMPQSLLPAGLLAETANSETRTRGHAKDAGGVIPCNNNKVMMHRYSEGKGAWIVLTVR